MKLYFLILFSVFTIESALATPKWCKVLWLNFKQNYSNSISNLSSLKESKRKRAIKKILKIHEPVVVEKILLQHLLTVQNPQIQKELLNALEMISQNDLSHIAQLTLSAVVNNQKTNIDIKKIIVNIFKNLENPYQEVIQAMIRTLERSSNEELTVLAFEFFENKEENQVLEIFKNLLLLKDKLTEDMQDDIFTNLISKKRTLEFLEVLRDILKNGNLPIKSNLKIIVIVLESSSSTKDVPLVKNLLNVAGSQKQSDLMDFLSSPDKQSIHAEVSNVLKDLEFSLEEVFQTITQVISTNLNEDSKN